MHATFVDDIAFFRAEMDHLFGNDTALGVYLVTDKGVHLPAAVYDALPADQRPDACSFLKTGGSAVCCTDYARLIFKTLEGRVKIFGFANEDNPTSRIAKKLIHPGGHDFAVVDDRFIVDPWPRLVPSVFDQMVFDLKNPDEASLVLDIYGPSSCWKHMSIAEKY